MSPDPYTPWPKIGEYLYENVVRHWDFPNVANRIYETKPKEKNMELSKEAFDELMKQCEEELVDETTLAIKHEIKRCLKSIKQQENNAQSHRDNLFDHINKIINSHDFNNRGF